MGMNMDNQRSSTYCLPFWRRVIGWRLISTFVIVACVVSALKYGHGVNPLSALKYGHGVNPLSEEPANHVAKSSVVQFEGGHKEPDIKKGASKGITILKREPTAKIPVNVSYVDIRKEYERLVENLGVRCDQEVRLGSPDPAEWNVCVSPPYNLQPPCLVYDFGIGAWWNFDDEITRIYGCTLRAFDPTINLLEHDRSDKIHFYPIGLWGSIGTHKRFPATTFRALLKRFGETTKTIDYLKIDIESSEWDALPTMLDDGSLTRVKQIGIELHATKNTVKGIKLFIDILGRLNSAGFMLWRSDWNNRTMTNVLVLGRKPACHEIYFVNINFI